MALAKLQEVRVWMKDYIHILRGLGNLSET